MNLQGGRELLEQFGAPVYELSQRFSKGGAKARLELERLIEETRGAHQDITARLHDGRDRLLELNSFRPSIAWSLVNDIHQQDDDTTLDDFMLQVFDQYSIYVDEIAPRTYKLGSAGVFAESFPGLPAEGVAVTCDRKRALVREDVQFLTWDHPLVAGALDLLLGSEKGNCCLDETGDGASMEAVYVLECVAPPHLHADRFLPPTPIRVVVEGEDFQKAEEMARAQVVMIVEGARAEMSAALNQEIDRLGALRSVNPSVRPEEIEMLKEQKRLLDVHLSGARLRLDAVRVRGD
jgi:ATP-dependent helicase HepA